MESGELMWIFFRYTTKNQPSFSTLNFQLSTAKVELLIVYYFEKVLGQKNIKNCKITIDNRKK